MDHVHRFLQANVNHSARAQDLLVHTMAEWFIDIAIVAEPYFVPPDREDSWAGDVDGSVAIVMRQSAALPPLGMVARGSGYVVVRVNETVVIGVYFSPNRSLAEFERFLGGLEALVHRFESRPVILAGDLNAKCTAWGSPRTDSRGEFLSEWAFATGLCLLNRGSVATCVRWNGESHVDVSFASPSAARRVRGWRVLEGAETLSDHRFVRFELSVSTLLNAPDEDARGEEELPRSAPRSFPRWALKRLNKVLAVEAATVAAWAPR
uniref:Endonuclease/exonuclease/phosphatase domain-containing protein n=1 Tax=Bombyx mori TaxID=7091 RepID=A0A8R2M440_BOMMO|nr:uncharacterized protein LOC119629797 [Bombyx mori]